MSAHVELHVTIYREELHLVTEVDMLYNCEENVAQFGLARGSGGTELPSAPLHKEPSGSVDTQLHPGKPLLPIPF